MQILKIKDHKKLPDLSDPYSRSSTCTKGLISHVDRKYHYIQTLITPGGSREKFQATDGRYYRPYSGYRDRYYPHLTIVQTQIQKGVSGYCD